MLGGQKIPNKTESTGCLLVILIGVLIFLRPYLSSVANMAGRVALPILILLALGAIWYWVLKPRFPSVRAKAAALWRRVFLPPFLKDYDTEQLASLQESFDRLVKRRDELHPILCGTKNDVIDTEAIRHGVISSLDSLYENMRRLAEVERHTKADDGTIASIQAGIRQLRSQIDSVSDKTIRGDLIAKANARTMTLKTLLDIRLHKARLMSTADKLEALLENLHANLAKLALSGYEHDNTMEIKDFVDSLVTEISIQEAVKTELTEVLRPSSGGDHAQESPAYLAHKDIWEAK